MTVDEFIAEWKDDNDFIIAHTSGSTGKPKKICLSKALVKQSARRTIEFFGLNSSSHLHLCLSPDYIAGKMMIVRALLSGASLTYETPSNMPLQNISSEQDIDLLAVVPSQLIHILNNKDIPTIRNLIVGGSAIPYSLRKSLAERKDLNAYETYGMTETASHVALRKIKVDASLPYQALPGIKFTIDNRGCLVINIDNLSPIVTNDLVELIDSAHFRLLGRVDNVIITGGLKVHPAQVETLIEPMLPHETQFYITSRPHPKWGEEVILMIEKNSGKSICIVELMQKLHDSLHAYQCPKQIIIVDHFERTSSGKIIRHKL